jgi:Arc/MetJ-type ribon-helix-helix transcriptional regulator
LSKTPKWTSVAFPSEIVEAIRELIEELKYWPSVSSFCRDAVLEKIDRERRKLKESRPRGGSRRREIVS